MRIVLDTNVLGKLCHPKQAKNRAIVLWFVDALANGKHEFYLPEISDFELRRKLIHMVKSGKGNQVSVERLDQLGLQIDYIQLNTHTLRVAAELWADARLSGRATAANESLDGDVILAAQAKEVQGTVLTENEKHLSRFVEVITPQALLKI